MDKLKAVAEWLIERPWAQNIIWLLLGLLVGGLLF